MDRGPPLLLGPFLGVATGDSLRARDARLKSRDVLAHFTAGRNATFPLMGAQLGFGLAQSEDCLGQLGLGLIVRVNLPQSCGCHRAPDANKDTDLHLCLVE
jgi:hypothetical protein